MKGLIFVSAAILTIFVLSCSTGKQKARLPTGVETKSLPGGQMQITATGRASENAISKDSPAMMRTTSREAARLLLKNELEKDEYKGKGQFDQSPEEFLGDGEYCRITGTFSPAKM